MFVFMSIYTRRYLCPRHLILQVTGHSIHCRAPRQLGISGGEPFCEPIQLLTQLP